LRISPKGKKSWICIYRVNGLQVMQTLGSLALIPKVETARQMARESQLQARAGTNPVAERRRVKEAETQKDVTTFKAIAERYFKEHVIKEQRADTAKETMRIFRKDILPVWEKRDITTISRKDVRQLLRGVGERGTKIMGNRVLSLLTTFFNWAIRQDEIEKAPTVGVDRPTKEVSRDRFLSDEEIVRFWAGCDAIGWPYGPCFKLLLLTGQRRDEVACATWNEFDIANRLWVILAERTKNGKVHDVHLSPLAIEVLESLPVINSGKYVFTATGENPISGWSSAKILLGKQMGGDLEPWTIHDLRRTAATGLQKLKIRQEVTEKILNHSGGKISGIAAIYGRHDFADERIAALDAWSRYIENLLHPAPLNVVAIERSRSA
jgi:integrase